MNEQIGISKACVELAHKIIALCEKETVDDDQAVATGITAMIVALSSVILSTAKDQESLDKILDLANNHLRMLCKAVQDISDLPLEDVEGHA